MTTGFQHQEQGIGYSIPRSTPAPQHGQKADAKSLKLREPRAAPPRPGH